MLQICIVGTGNVAKQLFDVFGKTEEVVVVQVVGRNAMALRSFGDSVSTSTGLAATRLTNTGLKTIGFTTTDFTNTVDADIYMIAVSDDAITTVSKFLRNKKGLVVHTSGSVSMDSLSDCGRYGVFYPSQTFSKDREINMESVPICLEAKDSKDLELLKNLAIKISEAVYEVDSEQRKALHLAAVFVNNFTNHLYHIGQQLCEKEGLPFEILRPLIKETANKISHLSPKEAQTGPARRGDVETIEKQLKQLGDSGYEDIYSAITGSIIKIYG